MRRAAFLVALLVVLAGCSAAPAGSSDPRETSPGECTERGHRTQTPARPTVTPGDLPAKPSTLTRTRAREYVVAYEEVYRRNHDLQSSSRRVSASASVEAVSDWRDGYLVRVSSWASGYDAAVTTGTKTATVLHWDGPRYEVAYFVTDDRLVRQQVDPEETPTVERGTTVECW